MLLSQDRSLARTFGPLAGGESLGHEQGSAEVQGRTVYGWLPGALHLCVFVQESPLDTRSCRCAAQWKGWWWDWGVALWCLLGQPLLLHPGTTSLWGWKMSCAQSGGSVAHADNNSSGALSRAGVPGDALYQALVQSSCLAQWCAHKPLFSRRI